MNMSKELYNFIEAGFRSQSEEYVRSHILAVLEEKKAKDLQKRIRWDLLYALRIGSPEWVRNELHELDNSHIDTALRKAMFATGLDKLVVGVAARSYTDIKLLGEVS